MVYNYLNGTLSTVTRTASGKTLTMGYDGLRRLSTVTGGIYGKTYTYRNVGSNTTTQVSSVTYDLPTDQTFGYTYDSMGNIAAYTDANGTVTYTYDALGQLKKAVGSTTYNYTYDNAGNILSGNGHTYTYGDATWADLLTAVDGETITYDPVGNPTSYYNGTRWTFTWAHGRNLETAAGGGNTLSFAYDADGLRTSKTVGGVVYTYYYASGKLLRETYGTNTLDFFYDASGNAYALKHNGTVYYYITNLQGDVMSIVDAQGAVVASYQYDPYGNIVTQSGTLADTNPLRYRGYYYDSETGFYYLQSRYYDPNLGRFLNADTFASTGQGLLGYNMFAYCGNNPINHYDPSGRAWCKVHFDDFSPLDSGIVPILGGGGGGYVGVVHTTSNAQTQVNRTTDQIDSFLNNTDEDSVLKAEYVAFYKGVLVIKIDALDNSAFSFGFITVGDNIDAETLRHEYGHYLHLQMIGWQNYISKVAIPSLCDYWSDLGYDAYYSEPQEYIADILGEVNRTNVGAPYQYSISDHDALMYFIISVVP